MKKDLRIGLVGYGFMGRTHSNAFLQVSRFFDVPYQPVLKAVCARNAERVPAFADNWGYEAVETDWRSRVEGNDFVLHETSTRKDSTCERVDVSRKRVESDA